MHYDDIQTTYLMYNNILAAADEYDKEYADSLKSQFLEYLKFLKGFEEYLNN